MEIFNPKKVKPVWTATVTILHEPAEDRYHFRIDNEDVEEDDTAYAVSGFVREQLTYLGKVLIFDPEAVEKYADACNDLMF